GGRAVQGAGNGSPVVQLLTAVAIFPGNCRGWGWPGGGPSGDGARAGDYRGEEESAHSGEAPNPGARHRRPGRQPRRAAGAALRVHRERVVHDYGIDLILFTYSPLREWEDGNVFLQIKATERLEVLQSCQAASFRVKRADLQGWLFHVLPVVLIV